MARAGSNKGIWSGARDLNPGPHGPEICAVSSTESVFERLELNSMLLSRGPSPIFIHRAPPHYYTNYHSGIYCWYRSFWL
jgi:hypothetical protein